MNILNWLFKKKLTEEDIFRLVVKEKNLIDNMVKLNGEYEETFKLVGKSYLEIAEIEAKRYCLKREINLNKFEIEARKIRHILYSYERGN